MNAVLFSNYQERANREWERRAALHVRATFPRDLMKNPGLRDTVANVWPFSTYYVEIYVTSVRTVSVLYVRATEKSFSGSRSFDHCFSYTQHTNSFECTRVYLRIRTFVHTYVRIYTCLIDVVMHKCTYIAQIYISCIYKYIHTCGYL